jgi:uncharacterized Zn finger protein
LKIDEGAVDRSVCGALDDAGVRRSFHPRTAARGYQYARSGRVLDIRMEDDGHVLHAKVAGSRLDMEEVERLFS